jgi:hypothetical protein
MDEPQYIDITPVGCKTPEGAARVNAAMRVVEELSARVASQARYLVDNFETEIIAALTATGDPEAVICFKDLIVDVRERSNALDELLIAVCGR